MLSTPPRPSRASSTDFDRTIEDGAGGVGTMRARPATTVSAATRSHNLLANLSQLLGTHALTAAAGIVTLPVLARNFGPESYGGLSLFVTLLGVVTYQDFLRPLLVRECAASDRAQDRDSLAALSLATTWGLCAVALVAGFAMLGPIGAIAFTLAVAAHSLASLDYARLAIAGRVGHAGAIRNCAFAGATLTVAGLSFVVRHSPGLVVHAYAWPFVAANVAILVSYRRLTGEPTRYVLSAETRRLAGEAWKRHRRSIQNLLGFGIAIAIVVSADRVLLEKFASKADFGVYAGCADLAVKLTIIGTAIGTVLYPMLSRAVQEDAELAARRFVRTASLVMLGWFTLILGLVVFGRDVLTLVLGERFAGSHAIYGWLLVGNFVHMLGFLLTPWQRARGDFATQTRAYWTSAALMTAVGLAAIPILGPAGAVMCYATARTAEVLMLAREARHLGPALLPRWKLAALAGMVAILASAAWVQGAGAR
jgi:O-antigen/teichoic acid export membrane protein